MRRITKLFNTKATSINEDTKTVTFVISDNQVDRYGEVVDQKSWNFKEYLKNPIVLWGHDPSEPENVLGTGASLKTAKDGSITTADITFDTAINPKADLVFNQVKIGTLRTVSVGFINHSEETENDTPILKDNDLLEISVVPIPANPRAIALSLKDGSLNTKDAKWLMDGMRKEADLLDAQIKEQTNELETKSMTEEQAQALLEGQGKLIEAVAALQANDEAMKEEIAALKPAEETAEEKTAREAQEAKDLADKEAAGKKAEDEAAALKAEEDEKAKEDLAKSGGDDQGGAKESEDDFDEGSDLTPEQEAELVAAIQELAPSH